MARFDIEKGDLYERAIAENTETPRRCHLRAIYCVAMGKPVPLEVQEAVLKIAERNKESLKNTMELINSSRSIRELSLMTIMGSITHSYGIDGPKSARKRLDMIKEYMYSFVLDSE